ncbi:hypothetical protein K437DRAFT_254309 [Tilletiaria anomala UBC 951]|uniref:Nucleoporin Nup54 alpha-helical domain-containing protein n=1 Tax=Tilletiaria anomala (strain ATCC 24038 / CBS 436.72 / UBC 951) TaxID=1037660 RepID=A0A066WEZ9_TILAU|nr:uncharacterized protein K437DRAFT_254309 [Tilletiaria anomala UBC 951]KDN52326.1 hypothetical protein K437DRAFT_254309 [Tilletiaria anomala UBC 951]
MAFSFGQPAASSSAPNTAGGTTGAGTFSFGQPATTTASAANATPATGAQAVTQSGGGGAFSFGKPAVTSAAPSAVGTSTFSFGAPAAQQQQQQAQPGQQQQQPSQQPATTGGSLFSFGGSQPAGGTLGGGLLGQPQPQQNQASQPPASGGLFGSSKTSAAPTTGSLFGQTSTNSAGTSLFGQNQQLQQSGALQPQQLQQPQQQTVQTQQAGLGASTSSAAVDPRKLGQPLNAQLEAVYKAWDTSDIASCKFRHYFYNNVGEQAIESLAGNPYAGRRPDAVGREHDALWNAAVSQNSDPKRLLPVLAVGFGDVKKRHQAQQGEATRQLQHLSVCSERLKALERKHSLSNAVRHSAAAAKQTDIHHRLMALVRKCHLLIPSLRGTSIEPEEEKLRAQLEALEAEIEGTGYDSEGAGTAAYSILSRPVGATRIRASINELWAQIGALRAKRDAIVRATSGSAAPGAVEWAVVDQETLDQVVKILGQQQKGLNHLSDTLTSDSSALDTIFQGLQGVKLVGVKGTLGARPQESL